MKIELKNVKYAAFASQETPCFSATIYIDGVKAAVVDNSGQGGPNDYHPWQVQERINEYAKTLPKISIGEGYPLMDQDCDSVIDDLLDQFLRDRDLKRLCSKKTLFRKPNETYKEGEYHTLKAPYSLNAAMFLRNKYGPSTEILNERFVSYVCNGKKFPNMDAAKAYAHTLHQTTGVIAGIGLLK